MEIILGKTAGFCYGVKRAVEGAKEEAKIREKVYCLGEIVHNKNVIESLEKEGIKFIENLEEARANVIIRAHGVAKEVYEQLENKQIKVKDLTCPNVLKIHKIAEEYSKKGYFIILVGSENHPEVIGTISFCGENSFIVQDLADIPNCTKKLEKSKSQDVLVIAQTTYNSKKFDEIVENLKINLTSKNLEINKTICMATEVRQNETSEIAKKVDVMIIIGDKKSSNTNKLYDISSKYCKKVFFVQNEDDLKRLNLKQEEKVGIMAGASTPEDDIEMIIKFLEENN